MMKSAVERGALRRRGEAAGTGPVAATGRDAAAPVDAGPDEGGAHHTGAAVTTEPERVRYRRVFACGTDAEEPRDEAQSS